MKHFFIYICLFFTSLYLSITFQIGQQVYNDTAKNSDAIIVLGAKSYKGNQYNPCLVARVETGVNLYKQGRAPKIIFSGGDDREDQVNEAETMKKIAIENGVPTSDILLEKTSTSTFENLVNTQKLLQENNLRSTILVSEPFHLPRVSLIATSLHMNYTVSPAITSPCWTRWTFLSRYFLKEPLAILYYWAIGKL